MIVGAVNWGLVGLGEFDLVATVFGLEFGETNWATRTIYSLVGLAGVYGIWSLAASRPRAARPSTVAGL